jgi:hypothetical protein
MGRIAEPEDVIGAALSVASPASAMVTGHVLAVDGGFLRSEYAPGRRFQVGLQVAATNNSTACVLRGRAFRF